MAFAFTSSGVSSVPLRSRWATVSRYLESYPMGVIWKLCSRESLDPDGIRLLWAIASVFWEGWATSWVSVYSPSPAGARAGALLPFISGSLVGVSSIVRRAWPREPRTLVLFLFILLWLLASDQSDRRELSTGCERRLPYVSVAAGDERVWRRSPAYCIEPFRRVLLLFMLLSLSLTLFL